MRCEWSVRVCVQQDVTEGLFWGKRVGGQYASLPGDSPVTALFYRRLRAVCGLTPLLCASADTWPPFLQVVFQSRQRRSRDDATPKALVIYCCWLVVTLFSSCQRSSRASSGEAQTGRLSHAPAQLWWQSDHLPGQLSGKHADRWKISAAQYVCLIICHSSVCRVSRRCCTGSWVIAPFVSVCSLWNFNITNMGGESCPEVGMHGWRLSKREGVLFHWWLFSSNQSDRLQPFYPDINLIWTSKPP